METSLLIFDQLLKFQDFSWSQHYRNLEGAEIISRFLFLNSIIFGFRLFAVNCRDTMN